MSNKKTITVLYAHGSSSKQWQLDIEQLTSNAVKLSDSVCVAHMELCPPSLEDIILKKGVHNIDKINVLPLFLATGKHLKVDIPKIIQELSEQYGIEIELLRPIGEHPLLSKALQQITANLLSENADGE